MSSNAVSQTESSTKNALPLTVLNVCGFYELDAQGTVLYAQFNRGLLLAPTNAAILDKNFFTEVFDCYNADELFRRFASFVQGKLSAESFPFVCRLKQSVVHLSVILARGGKNGSPNEEPLYYLNINNY